MSALPHSAFEAELKQLLGDPTAPRGVSGNPAVSWRHYQGNGCCGISISHKDTSLIYVQVVRVKSPNGQGAARDDYQIDPDMRTTVREILGVIGELSLTNGGPDVPKLHPVVSVQTFAEIGFHKPVGVRMKFEGGLTLWLQLLYRDPLDVRSAT